MVKGLLICAALIGLAFLVCHAAGLRESTGVLSGTYTGTGSVISGLAYAVVYMGFVILAPIFVLGAGALFLLDVVFARG
ncbi:MAG: hypothetical protein JW918_00210 [Anaerolineae bacterium]|nr:hypothetical protein [Anaerolineae bacterium]